LSALHTCCTTEAAFGYLSVMVSVMLVSVSIISGIPVLGREPPCCTLKFTA
jgi:hypothetical protein